MSRGGVAIQDVDHGYAELVQAVFKLGKPKLHVGILEDKPRGDGVSLLDLATWMEFGTQTIPARSFIREWFDGDEGFLRETLVKLMQSVLRGERTAEQALEVLGQIAVGRVQERISSGIEPPNAPSTIAKKGSSTPLIDHGILRASVTYRVDPG